MRTVIGNSKSIQCNFWKWFPKISKVTPGGPGAPSMAYDGHETPGFDFDTDPARLPTGAIQIDTIQIQFKSARQTGRPQSLWGKSCASVR